jgi:hypothetical protein
MRCLEVSSGFNSSIERARQYAEIGSIIGAALD